MEQSKDFKEILIKWANLKKHLEKLENFYIKYEKYLSYFKLYVIYYPPSVM